MVSVEDIAALPLFRDLPVSRLASMATAAREGRFSSGEFIVRQHDEARNLFILVSGSVQFLLRFEGMDDLLVGTHSEYGALIGWAAFRAPYRYTASVRCEQPCRVIRIPRTVFEDLLSADPHTGYRLLSRVTASVADRLERARDLLVSGRRLEGEKAVR